MKYKIGQGFDVHQLVEGRKLILCGVEIPYHLGLLGHSDADVAIHALCDALLGASGLGDIGQHFPDTDNRFKNIDSRILLRNVARLLEQNGYAIGNVDITIIAQAPKLSPFRKQMIDNLSVDLHISPEEVSLKATTTEHLGFTGRGEGIAALAACIIEKI